MRITDLSLVLLALGAVVMVVEARNHIDLGQHEIIDTHNSAPPKAAMITCPLRKPEFAVVMQAAFLGDGTLLVEQQTNTQVRHIKDC